MILFLILLLIFILFLLLMIGVLRTWQVQHDRRQQIFLCGKIPKQLPDGFYRGSATGYRGAWQGKKFDRSRKSGLNILLTGGKPKEKFPFVTYVGQGESDQIQVIKIDYNISSNSWWLKLILDEIVAVNPHKYLGKVHLILPLGIVFSLGYFSLERASGMIT